MSRDRLYRAEAIIIKRTDVGEADRLLTLLTPSYGKLRAVAKGARKPSSRKTGHVELFNRAALMIASGRELDVVTQADTLESFLKLRTDLDRLSYAYYFAELVDSFTEEEEENRPLYDLMVDSLRRLETTGQLPRTARYFELHLLEVLGYRPQFATCVNCRRELEPRDNFFSPEGGGMLDPQCRDSHRDARPVSLNALKVLRFLQNREFPEVDKLSLGTGVETEVEEILHYNLTHSLERNLKSIAFLNTLRANTISSRVGESS